MRNALLVLLCNLFLATALQAQSQNVTSLLIPVYFRGDIPGAFGAIWRAEFWVRNNNPDPATLEGLATCLSGLPCSGSLTFPGQSEGRVPTEIALPCPGNHALVNVQRAQADALEFNLRVRDLSRQSATWGTEVPVVREDDFLRGTINLLNMPVDARFRVTVRLYGLPPFVAEQIWTIRAIAMTTGDVVLERTVIAGDAGLLDLCARQATLSTIADEAGASMSGTFRLEITPASTDMRYWAFASITNNETQHVTLVTPQ